MIYVKDNVPTHCMAWTYPNFVHVMQVHKVSHAIYQAKCKSFKNRLRTHYHEIHDLINLPASSRKCQDVLNELTSRLGHIQPLVEAGIDSAWTLGADLAGLSGEEVSMMVNDDRVPKACLFAQVLWLYADDDVAKNMVAMSILSGTPHRMLESYAPQVASQVHQVLNVLHSCPSYAFKACPGFEMTLHVAHITNEDMYNEFCEKGLCPFLT